MGQDSHTGQGAGLTHSPGQNRMEDDVAKRAMLGQLINPPNTAIATPLQQGISNLQSGDPGRAFGLSGGIASRLSGGDSSGFAPGSFAANAPGGQQGLQSREQLGLPDRKTYMGDFMPTADQIREIGLPPIASDDNPTNKLNKRQLHLKQREEVLQARIGARTDAGQGHGLADQKLAAVQAKEAKIAARRKARIDAAAGGY